MYHIELYIQCTLEWGIGSIKEVHPFMPAAFRDATWHKQHTVKHGCRL